MRIIIYKNLIKLVREEEKQSWYVCNNAGNEVTGNTVFSLSEAKTFQYSGQIVSTVGTTIFFSEVNVVTLHRGCERWRVLTFLVVKKYFSS